MSEAKPFAAFDVDGTVFKSSLAEKVVGTGITRKLFAAEPFNEVYENRKRWQENNNEGTYQAYIKRLVGALVNQMAGVEVAQFQAAVAELVEEHKVRRFKFPRRLMRAVHPTHRIIAISGSPQVILEPFLADLPIDRIYGSDFHIEDGYFTGEAQSVGDKAAVLRKLETDNYVTRQGSMATGDTVGDIPALEYAEHPIMFNPSHTLASYGQEFGWDQVLEVKDRMLVVRRNSTTGVYELVDVGDYIDMLRDGGSLSEKG